MMIIALLTNFLLVSQLFYQSLFTIQILFYGTAIYGWYNRKDKELSSIVYIPMYFTVMNIALFKGFLRYLNGSQKVTWDKAKR